MQRILFVDDEPNILAGLQRTMRVMRNEWNMSFIEDPQQALDAFVEQPFDVVVSDMKMPGIDGADLLSEIKRKFPGTIRIILSGHADPAMVMKSVGATHQYLAKPCEPETLKATVQRAYALREMISNESLQILISEMGDLPSIPSVYQEIVAAVQDPEGSLGDVSAIISKDLAMTTKILQLVNSAFFGVASPVTTIERAVSYLGLDTIGALVLGQGVFSSMPCEKIRGFDMEELWFRSTRTAELAKAIAVSEGLASRDTEEAFLAGLLCDVGHLILASKKPQEYAELLRRIESGEQSATSLEVELFAATHGAVGAYLVGLWGLPDSIVEAVSYHESPARCDTDQFGLQGIVHVASRLAENPSATEADDPKLRLDLDFLQNTGVLNHWEIWQEAIRADAR